MYVLIQLFAFDPCPGESRRWGPNSDTLVTGRIRIPFRGVTSAWKRGDSVM